MSITALQSHYHKTLTVLFILIICMPSAKMIFSPAADWSKAEKRKLAVRPDAPRSLLQIPGFFSGLETYLSDHFGYREYLINRYHREMKKRFGKFGKESNVLLGRDGWYFYAAEAQIEDYTGQLKLSENQLQSWVAERQRRALWCRQRGIEYLLVVPPEKQNIYPEFFPKNIAPSKGTSRFEQLTAFLETAPLPYLLDLSRPLRAAKGDKDLFYKTDTHWNLRGSFIGFTAILEALRQRFPDIAFTVDFTIGDDVTESCSKHPTLCDLSSMAMQAAETTITYQEFMPFNACAQPGNFDLYGFSNLEERQDKPSFARSCANRQLTALIFRDSFFDSLESVVSENFRHTIYLWKTYDEKNIEEALKIRHIDVVIEEVVERSLFKGIPE
jgi:alginate O-acetyltransferase complex protein AlgJ